MIKQSKSLLIIDHHKSAKENLELVPDINKIFDMKHSGAYLTWNYFYPESEIPLLIRYIEDHDIWLHKMPNSSAVTSYIRTLPFEFKNYEELLDDYHLQTIIIPKAIILQEHDKYYINQALSNSATIQFIELGGMYYFIAMLNSTILASEIGHELLNKYKYVNFSVVYSFVNNKYHMSLRSNDNRTDVSMIAKQLGGGGHRNASGISTNTSSFPANIIDGGEILYKLLNNIVTNDDVLILNISHNKKEFGKYLLQICYEENYMDGKRSVQNYCAFMRQLSNNNNYYFFNYSLMWNVSTNCYNIIETKLSEIPFKKKENIPLSLLNNDQQSYNTPFDYSTLFLC
jgi:hypothetical protein